MCGATCISDAVFNLKFGLHKRTSWIDNTIEPSLTLQWPVSWLCHMCRRKEQRWGQNQQQQDLDDGSWMLGRTNRHYIGCYMWKDWYWILDVCKNKKSSLYMKGLVLDVTQASIDSTEPSSSHETLWKNKKGQEDTTFKSSPVETVILSWLCPRGRGRHQQLFLPKNSLL